MTVSIPALARGLAMACVFSCQALVAQAAPSSSDAASAAERAQKQTDRTMYWIRVLADKPATARASVASKPVATPAVATSAKPLAEAHEKVRLAAAPTAAPAIAHTGVDAMNPAPSPAAATERAMVLPGGVDGASDPGVSTGGSNPSDVGGALALPTPAPAAVAPEQEAGSAPAEESDGGLVRLKMVEPEFPSAVVSRIRKGDVEVRFEVEPGGTVVDAEVVQSSSARLNAAAVEAIKQWRFKPSGKSHTAVVKLVFDIDS